MEQTQEKFSQYCIVELMGHQKVVGFVTERALFGANLMQVDVPAVSASDEAVAIPAWTKMYGPAAIYAVTPVSEELALAMVARLRQEPINIYCPELYPPSPPRERGRLVAAHAEPDDEELDCRDPFDDR